MKQTDDEKDEKISIRELLVDSILNSLNLQNDYTVNNWFIR